MPTYPVKYIDDQPTFSKPIDDIACEVKPGGALKVIDPVEYHTDRQHRWYQGVALTGLSNWNGETREEWDHRLKMECGLGLLKKETFYISIGVCITRLTTKGVGKRNMTAFIENILSKAITMEWPVTEPDAELRK